jgi:hypothetical protein
MAGSAAWGAAVPHAVGVPDAAGLRHVTVAIGADPMRPVVGPGGIWAVGLLPNNGTVLQRIDPRTNRPVGPRITLPEPTFDVGIQPGAIWVDRWADRTHASRGLVKLDPSSGAQVGGPLPVAPDRTLDGGQLTISICGTAALGMYRVVCAAANWHTVPNARAVWIVAHTNDSHDAETAVRIDPATGAETARAPLAPEVRGIDVDRSGAVWTSGYHGALRATARGSVRVPRSVGAWPAVAVDRHAAWAVGQLVRRPPGGTLLIKRLQRLDLRTARPMGRPLVLGSVLGSFYPTNHIRIWAGSAWISGPRDGTLTRVYLPGR